MKNGGKAYGGSDKPMPNSNSKSNGGEKMDNKSGGIMTGEHNSKMQGGGFKPGPDSPLNKGPYNS